MNVRKKGEEERGNRERRKRRKEGEKEASG